MPPEISSGNWCAAFASYCAQHAAGDGEAIPLAYRVGHVGRVCARPDGQGAYETVDGNHLGAVARVRRTLGDAVGWIAYP